MPAHATTSLSPLSGTRVLWAKVDSGFWVAHRGGEYYGCVDSVKGGFVARDAHGVPVGRYETLEAARASLRSTGDPVNLARRGRAERATMVLATAAGSAAFAFALTAGALAPYL